MSSYCLTYQSGGCADLGEPELPPRQHPELILESQPQLAPDDASQMRSIALLLCIPSVLFFFEKEYFE